jgi:hypothetical protein
MLEEQVLNVMRDRVNKINPNTQLGRLLFYSPIDSYGRSNIFYFSNIINKKDGKLIPNNGVQWERNARKYLNVKLIKKGNKTIGYKFDGFNINNEIKNRQINPEIRKYFDDKNCAHTGLPNKNHNKHEIDHKNGRYNEDDVFNIETQKIADFQPLTQESNKQKREVCKKCKKTNKRYDATYLGYNIPLIEGTLEYNEELGCIGCYWYDCNKFKKSLGLINGIK